MRQQIKTVLIFAATALLGAVNYSHAAGLPEKFEATYTLSAGPLTLAEMTRKLYPKGDGSYVYESHSKPVGYARWFTNSTLVERSEWRYEKQQPRPLLYSYDRTGDRDKERHVKLIFDWVNGVVTNIINKDPWKMEIPPGAQDKLLYQLTLVHDLQLGQRAKLEYNVADGGSVKNIKFEIIGEERIKTAIGEFDTLKLKTEGTRTTTLWCAKTLGYFPVLIEQHDDRGQALLKLTSLSGITATVAQPSAKNP
jgi:hypothetical protein